MCDSFRQFCLKGNYTDSLIEIKNKYAGYSIKFEKIPLNFEDVLELIQINQDQSITYQSNFFQRIIKLHGKSKWVDIEVFYFPITEKPFSKFKLFR